MTGLPLTLLVAVVVVGVGLFIILSWTGKIGGGPDAIQSIGWEVDDAEVSQITVSPTDPSRQASASIKLAVWAYDSDGGTVQDAAITLSGAIREERVGVTEDDGGVIFTGLDVSLPPQKMTGEVKVRVDKSGWAPYESTILVVRG